MLITKEQYMPHMSIEYSAGLNDDFDIQRLCEELRLTMINTGIFPLGGIRVRAFAAVACAIADDHQDNEFVDMVLRIGKGRSGAEKQNAGEAIMATAQVFFMTLLEKAHFALSLEIIEIDPDMSWKVNTIHPRLKNT